MLSADDKPIADQARLSSQDLTPQQGYLMSLCDGVATAGQIVHIAQGDPAELMLTLNRWHQEGLVEVIGTDVQSFANLVKLAKGYQADGDLYKLLAVQRNADGRKLKQAFHRQALRFHPDKIPKACRNDDQIVADVEMLYEAIQEAFDILSNPERKRAWAKERLHARRGGAKIASTKEQQLQETEPVTRSRDSVKADTLLILAKEAKSKGQFKPALRNVELAQQLGFRTEDVMQLEQDLKKCIQIDTLLSRLADTTVVDDAERSRIEKAFGANIEQIAQRKDWLKKAIEIAINVSLSRDCALELFARLRSSTMTADEYALGARLYRALGLRSTALELIEEGLARYKGDSGLKQLKKDAKK